MDKVLINPSAKRVQELVDQAIAEVDKRQKVRTLDSYCFPGWRSLPPEGGIHLDGGAVCNSYRNTAYTSALSIVWWKDGWKRRHVRIVAERTYAKHAPCGNASCIELASSGWAGVYPKRALKALDLLDRRKKSRLERRGPLGEDDRFSLRRWDISACSDEGLLIADSLTSPSVAQVVVTCPSTGCRHHIGVPPKFVNPKTKFYQKFKSSAERIHAAIAWTFNLSPEEYQVTTES